MSSDRHRFPVRTDCPACEQPILVVLSRRRASDAVPLAFDPEPDGDGDHFDTVLSDDKSYAAGSGEATAADCKGRFPLYRPHFWTCPQRLGIPGGRADSARQLAGIRVGGYWYRDQ